MGGNSFLSSHKRIKAGLSYVSPALCASFETLEQTIGMGTPQWNNIKSSHNQGVKRINCFQSVDATLLLGEASRIITRRFELVLDQFTQIFWGLVNKNKSQIYAWNIDARSIMGLAQILSFPISKDRKLFKYSGMPICLKSIPEEHWHIIIQKIKEKMES